MNAVSNEDKRENRISKIKLTTNLIRIERDKLVFFFSRR